MRRPSVKIVGWLVDMLDTHVKDIRKHLADSPNDLMAKRWLTQAEASFQVARQVHNRAKDEKAEFKSKEKKNDTSNAV